MVSFDALFQSENRPGAPDPTKVEDAGQHLAAALAPLDIEMVVCWYRVEDAVLAHVVARELSVPIGYAFDSEGLLSLSESVAGLSVALVAVDFPYTNDLPGLSGVVRTAGGRNRAVASGQSGLNLLGTAAEGAVIAEIDSK